MMPVDGGQRFLELRVKVLRDSRHWDWVELRITRGWHRGFTNRDGRIRTKFAGIQQTKRMRRRGVDGSYPSNLVMQNTCLPTEFKDPGFQLKFHSPSSIRSYATPADELVLQCPAQSKAQYPEREETEEQGLEKLQSRA